MWVAGAGADPRLGLVVCGGHVGRGLGGVPGLGVSPVGPV
jgi:hypothetical protein